MPDLLEMLRSAGFTPAKQGREWHSPCPSCGGADRFIVWPDKARCWCRQCRAGGDAVALVRLLNPAMGYREACAAVGVEPRPIGQPGRHNPAQAWAPREEESPPGFWWYRARAFVTWAHTNLMSDPDRMAWLSSERGITPESAGWAKIGWNPKDWHLPRQEWGLPDGKGLWVPAGLVLPTRNRFGTVVKVNIRRPGGNSKYACIEGGNMAPMVAGVGKFGAVVVESDLDAILTAQEAGDLVTVISLGGTGNHPDLEAHRILTDGRPVLVALDSDSAGARAAWDFWHVHYPRAIRWGTPGGKDPADAWKAGLPIRPWVVSGLRTAMGKEGPPAEGVVSEHPQPIPDATTGTGEACSGRSTFETEEEMEERAAIKEFDGVATIGKTGGTLA